MSLDKLLKDLAEKNAKQQKDFLASTSGEGQEFLISAIAKVNDLAKKGDIKGLERYRDQITKLGKQ